MADCKATGDIQSKLKKLFTGTTAQLLDAEMDEHLGYEKDSVHQEDLSHNLFLIDSRPRKCLGWKSSNQVFLHEVAHLTWQFIIRIKEMKIMKEL